MATNVNDLYGVWELRAWEVEKNGTFQPRGTNAKGLLIYLPTGHMSVTITSEAPGIDMPPAAAPPMIFYAGTFELRGDEIVHHAQYSFDPKNFTNVRRRVKLEGDVLELRTPAEERREVRLEWHRVARLPA